jgi:photosystem II stability/assembly factor-like uncharacterized protein
MNLLEMRLLKTPSIKILSLLTMFFSSFLLSAPSAIADVSEENLEGMEFRSIGPFRGGRSPTISGVIGDNLTYYFGSTGGGVWKTGNGGLSWENISDDYFGVGSIGAIGVAPSDSNVIYVGSGSPSIRGVAASHGDGVYKSTDSGATWVHIGLDDTRQITEVVVHPTNPDIVYVAAQGSPWQPTDARGIYRSKDGGATWDKILFVDKNTGVSDFKMDATNPRVLYAAMWDHQRQPWKIRSGGAGSAIHKSTDGGETWKIMGEGLPDLMGKIGVAPSPANPDRVWAVVEAKEKGGLYRSEDGGENWSLINQDRRLHARSWYYMHVFADPKDANTVYVLNSTFFRSVDGGKSIAAIRGMHGDHHDLWVNPDDPKNIANANDGGATISFDDGKTWSSQFNQPTGQFYRVNVDNSFPYKVYGGQQDNSTVALNSRGLDGSIGRDDYISVGGCESAHIAFDPDDTKYIYSGCYLGIIEEFDTENKEMRDIQIYPELAFGVSPRDRKYRFNWNAPIIVSQHDPSVIYHAGNHLFKSIDRGHSWDAISPDLTRNEDDKQGPMGGPITNEISELYNTIMYVAESHHDAGIIWVGTDDGLIHLTKDAGATWSDITPPRIGAALINHIEVSKYDPATAYIAITLYKYNDFKPMIYKTTNYGKRWKKIVNGISDNDYTRVVKEDPVRQNLLYAGTETGLYISFDGGKKWNTFQLNLPVVPVTDIKVHGEDLVLSTQGRGFYILDDLTPLRSVTDKLVAETLHLYSPKHSFAMRTVRQPNGGMVSNPQNGAVIYYSLSQELDLEEATLTMDIIDDAGKVLRTIVSDKAVGVDGGGDGVSAKLSAKAGLNKFIWDFNIEEAMKIDGVFTIAAGSNRPAIGGFPAPPGNYIVKLSLGDESAEQALTVGLDPRSNWSDEDLAERTAVSRSILNTVDELSRSVTSVRAVKSRLQAIAGAEKSLNIPQELIKTGEALVEKIDAWQDSVVSPEREFFQDVLNWPDRLYTDLQFLYFGVSDSVPPLTEGMQQRYDDLMAKWSSIKEAREAILLDISTYNKAYSEAGLPAVLTPPMQKQEEE